MIHSKISNQDLMRRLKHLSKTVECGEHSGFPACCIAFYIIRNLSWTKRQYQNYAAEIRKSHINFQYIPCPKCLKQSNKIEIKSCPSGSRCQHSEECAGNF